jgi:hypothetical protein
MINIHSIAASLFGAIVGFSAHATPWPQMADFEMRVGVDTSASEINISVPLRDTRGQVRYLLVCRGGKQDRMDAVSMAKNINYVPPLMCILNDGNIESEQSLLSEDDSPAWHSRGMFQWADLVGTCGAYPEFGRVRHFRLRGFRLTLEARDVVEKNSIPSSFTFHVRLVRDSKADSPIAERPGFLLPSDNCHPVRRGKEPRMCRNWVTNVGSYEPCKEP